MSAILTIPSRLQPWVSLFSFMALIQAIGFFFGHGSGNFISRSLGKKEYDKAKNMAATGFFLPIAVGTLIMVLGLLFTTPLSRMLGATETALPYQQLSALAAARHTVYDVVTRDEQSASASGQRPDCHGRYHIRRSTQYRIGSSFYL